MISHQLAPIIKAEAFQVWELQREKEHVFKVRATYGNDKVFAMHLVPFSDFSYDKATVWLVDGVLMLPSEY